MCSFYLVNIVVLLLRSSSYATAPLIQGIILHTILLAILTAIALLLSTRLHADAATTLSFIVSIFSFIFIPKIPTLTLVAEGASGQILKVIYYILPHLDLFDMRHRMVHDWGAAPWSIAFASLVYGILWTSVLLGLTWLSYRNKRFQRGIHI